VTVDRTSRKCPTIALIVAVLLVQTVPAGAVEHYVNQGIAVDLDIAAPDGLRAGDDVRLTLHLSDATSGTPLTASKPAAWLSLNRRGGAADDHACTRKVAAFLGSNPVARPEVDLTGFALLSLNRDPSITVIDPQGGYNGSRTITELALDSPGADWAVAPEPPRLYVSEPAAKRIAMFDTERWRRVGEAVLPDAPGPVLLQHDGRRLWSAPETGGDLVALDTGNLAELARIPLGRGAHRLAITADDRFLLVSNRDDGTVSVVDLASTARIRDIRVGDTPGPLAVSALAGVLYVALGDAVAVVDPARDQPPARIDGISGAVALGITPDGRWGFAASPAQGRVTIFDTVTNRVTQQVPVADQPYEIGFTDTQAYIRRRDSEVVTVIPLAPLGTDGKLAGLAEFPVGDRPDPANDAAPLAASMVASPGESAMLLASAAGHAVPYYHEGMAAASDSFDTFGHQPVAVTIADRSLRQTAPGTYGTVLRLPRAGPYDLAVLLDSPRISHCFALDVAAPAGDQPGDLALEPVSLPSVVPAGRPVALSFRVTQRSAGAKPLGTLTALAILAPGSWFQRVPMVQATNGLWRLEFTPPEAGIYRLAFESPGQMSVDSSPHFSFEASAPKSRRAAHD
jgi:YVTN family beta-propeller protein